MINPLHGDAQFNEFLRYTDLHRLCFGGTESAAVGPDDSLYIYSTCMYTCTPLEIVTLALECHFHLVNE